MATSTQINAITALYVGYFDRAPDPAGLQFWIDQIDNGREFNTIAADFAASAEAVALYPYLTTPDVSSPAAFITNIYANLFGRTPDDEGLDFWTGVLEDGSVSVADMIEAIIMGARDDATAGTFDKSVLDNKVEVGLDFAQETGNVAGFQFDAAAKAAAVAAVNGVTEDEATVAQAKAATDAYVANGTVAGEVGDTFTLTTGVDTLAGGADADTFQAILDTAANNGTINTFDNVKGGAGMDTLNVAGGGGIALPTSVTFAGIEVVNIATTAAVTGLNSSSFGGVQQLWQIGAAGALTVGAGVTAGFRDVAVTAAEVVTVADGVTSASVALDDVTGPAVVRFAETTGGDLETVTVSGSISNGNVTVNTAAGTTAVDTINLALTSDGTATLVGDATVVTDVNASTSTGDLIINTSALTALETLTGGEGDDALTVDINAATADIAIDGGAGNDVFVTGANAANTNGVQLSLTGGAGEDTFDFSAGAFINVLGEADFADQMIIINDFSVTDDVLDFSGLTQDVLTNAELSNISAAANLEAAVDAAAQVTAAGEVSLFNYGGDAYALHTVGGAANLANGDGLIKITGLADIDTLDASALVF